MREFIRAVDRFTDISTKIMGWFVCIVMLIMCYEVFMRYVFRSPTKWVHETTQYIFGVAAIYCGAYCIKEKKHITVDLVYGLFPPRVRAFIDLLMIPIIMFWGYIFIYYGTGFAWEAFYYGEISFSTLEAPLGPVKMWIPIAGIIIILQAFCMWMRSLYMVVKGEPLNE